MASYIVEKDRLTGEYKQTFERVESYAMLEDIGQEAQEEMLSNLVDMLYTAQTEGKPVSRIIGKDVEHFCKGYFEDQIGLKGRLLEIPAWLYRISWVTLVFALLDLCLGEHEGDFWTATTNISSIAFGILLGAVLVICSIALSRKLLFRMKKVNATALSFIILVTESAVIIAITFALPVEEWSLSVPICAAVIVAAVYIIIYKVLHLTRRYRRYGSLKNPNRDSSLRAIMNDTLQNEMPETFTKNFHKKNRKLREKGKSELSWNEYCESMRRSYRRVNLFLITFYSTLWIVLTVSTAIDNYASGIEVWNTILFATMEGAILLAVYRLFHYSPKAIKRVDGIEANGPVNVEN